MTKFDIGKIIAYIIGFGAAFTPDVVSRVLLPFGASQEQATRVVAIVGAIVIVATLISNTLRNPSPPSGMASVVAPKDTAPLQTADLMTMPTELPTPDPAPTTSKKGSK